MRLLSFSILVLLLSLSESAFAKKYIVVGVAGYGTHGKEGSRISGAHENLPKRGKIFLRAHLNHHSNDDHLDFLLNFFQCKNGVKKNKDLGLMIMINSWGATRGHELAQRYRRECGVDVDSYYVVDGVAKLIGAFKAKPAARNCYNFYQTRGIIRGGPIKGCVNFDMTSDCQPEDSGLQCHVNVEQYGTLWARDHMIYHFLNSTATAR